MLAGSVTIMTEVFATGIQMGESPRWHDGAFWMCDWVAGEVLRFDGAGGREVVTRVDGLPFSIDWLPDGRLIATTPAGVRVLDGTELAPYASSSQPSNEIVVDGEGRLWVDMPGSMPWEPRKPGTISVVLPSGETRQAAGDVWFPNGMVILGDDTLVVAESHADRLTAWRITSSGTLADRRVWAELGEGSAPDGICADADGAIWYASVPGQRCTRVAEGGGVLESIEVDRGCFSCALGGHDGRTLYIVANRFNGGEASDGMVLTQKVTVGLPTNHI